MAMSAFEVLKYLFTSHFKHRSEWYGDKHDRAFRKAVKKKYNGECAVTGKNAGLEIHHLEDVSTHPELRAVPANGVLIHKSVHKAFHKWNGGHKVPCTAQKFRQFLKEYK